MAPVFAKLCGVDTDTPISQVTREQRMAIGHALKALPLHVVGTRPIEEAIVTRGGVDVLEITPGTMNEQESARGCSLQAEWLVWMASTGGFTCKSQFSTARWRKERGGVGDGSSGVLLMNIKGTVSAQCHEDNGVGRNPFFFSNREAEKGCRE